MTGNHKQLFHYTSVSALKSILETNSLWASEATHLNDSSELQMMWSKIDGAIRQCYQYEVEKVSALHPELGGRIETVGGAAQIAGYDAAEMVRVMRTLIIGDDSAPGRVSFFVASFTTHGGGTEFEQYHSDHGMLSQWRSYGGEDGVAIVFDEKDMQKLCQTEYDHFQYWPILFEEVFYVTNDGSIEDHFPELFGSIQIFVHEFISCSIEGNFNGSEHEKLTSMISQCGLVLPRLKNVAFHEERECRIVVGVPSESVHDEARGISANEQRSVKKIHYRSGYCGSIPYVSLFEDCSLNLPIKRIIIGPSRKQAANYNEVQKLVEHRGIKVQRSETPYKGSA